ncbi:MAG: hypothetical protein M3Z07_03620 [Candidatus Eremiobacteraeota bacterium]|nr:hypothetical protein [Candidatus Eremiobacteraeota bacterium]
MFLFLVGAVIDSLSPRVRPAHPLAYALIECLRPHPGANIREIGTGSGRNRAALIAAGFRVNAPEAYDAALSTHALLHGRASDVARVLADVTAALKDGAPFFSTFGSQRDARFGKGVKLDECSYSPVSGDEAGVPHCYFDETELRRLLEPYLSVEFLEQVNVDEIVGKWAHVAEPLSGAVHWFVRARTPGTNT